MTGMIQHIRNRNETKRVKALCGYWEQSWHANSIIFEEGNTSGILPVCKTCQKIFNSAP